jgi:hypothetical protein
MLRVPDAVTSRYFGELNGESSTIVFLLPACTDRHDSPIAVYREDCQRKLIDRTVCPVTLNLIP